jgi:hypothetical protein
MAARPWQDSELEYLFKQQKQAEAKHTPSFDDMWETALEDTTVKKKSTWRFSLVAAASLLLVLNLGIYQMAQRSSPDPVSTTNISQWQAPTKVLLPTALANSHTKAKKHSSDTQKQYSISDWQPPSDDLLPTGIGTGTYY